MDIIALSGVKAVVANTRDPLTVNATAHAGSNPFVAFYYPSQIQDGYWCPKPACQAYSLGAMQAFALRAIEAMSRRLNDHI
jgi:hypothetical protein